MVNRHGTSGAGAVGVARLSWAAEAAAPAPVGRIAPDAAVQPDDPSRSRSRAAGATGRAAAGADHGYVPEVDALRALAMTGVILMHCGLLPFGWMGVWLFFVVSGFAVSTSLLGGAGQEPLGRRAILRFHARRALRIWPVYIAFVLLGAVYLAEAGRWGALVDMPWLLSFTFNLDMIFKTYTPRNAWSGFAHLWTLSVEQQFYLVFPFLLLLRGRRARSMALLAAIAAAPAIRAAAGAAAHHAGWDAERAAFAVYAFGPAHFDAFALGTLIALYRRELTGNRRAAALAAAAALLVTLTYGGIYAWLGVARAGGISVEALRNIVSGILYGDGRQVLVYYVPVSMAVAALTGILAAGPAWLRLGRLPGLQAIGRVSYGGYLFHLPVLIVLLALAPGLGAHRSGADDPGALGYVLRHGALFVIAYAVTLAVAASSFVWFESPIARLGRKRAR